MLWLVNQQLCWMQYVGWKEWIIADLLLCAILFTLTRGQIDWEFGHSPLCHCNSHAPCSCSLYQSKIGPLSLPRRGVGFWVITCWTVGWCLAVLNLCQWVFGYQVIRWHWSLATCFTRQAQPQRSRNDKTVWELWRDFGYQLLWGAGQCCLRVEGASDGSL